MKIRQTLLALTLFLGGALAITVGLQIRTEVLEYLEAKRLSVSNAVREDLLIGAGVLAEERRRTYALLLNAERRAEARDRLETARRHVDAVRRDLEARIALDAGTLTRTGSGTEVIARVWRELGTLRQEADAALSGAPTEGQRYASRWFAEMTRLIRDTESVRLTLLQQERPQSPALRSESLIRYYAGLLGESLAQNEALLTQALAGRAGLGNSEIEVASRNAGRIELAWHLIREQVLASPLPEEVTRPIRNAEDYYHATLEPLQQTLLGSLRGRSWASIGPDQWSNAATGALTRVKEMQAGVLDSSRRRLDAEVARAQRSLLLWTLLFLAGAAAAIVSTLVVRNRVVLPLEALSGSMLRLAEDDLGHPMPRYERADEIGEMSDALRVFRANAIRRQRLEQDKQALHARLREAYGQLRRDLEAAALIQTALLPAPSTFGNVRFCGLYLPSSVIAGDTYNVVEQADGRIGFFQVDVAGHGAPAALVSVATHHALSQALAKRSKETSLLGIAAQLNAEWSNDLPYFTMILGELDPRTNRATLIQAGHPSPILIGADGSVKAVGDGGFPVGLFGGATYEPISFSFGPGDRLLLYSDGVVDAESPSGQPFSEERLLSVMEQEARHPTPDLLAALRAALKSWRGSGSLEDDVSVLVLEHVGGPVRSSSTRPELVGSVLEVSSGSSRMQ